MTLPDQTMAADPARLTTTEFGVWLASRERVETFNVHWAWELEGDLDEAALRAAVADLLLVNPALRRVVDLVDGVPSWQTRPSMAPDVDVVDVTDSLNTWLTREGRHRFDLAADCPLRVRLVRHDGHAALSVLAHHIAVDGHAMELLAAQLSRFYTARRLGQQVSRVPTPMPVDVPLPNVDDYWTEHLRDAEWPDVLGGERRKAAQQIRVPLTPGDVADIHRFARDCRSSVLLLGLAALAITLRQYGSERDVMVAMPVAHRSPTDMEIVACRAQMVPVRQRWAATATGYDLLRSVRRTVGQALAHADAPMMAAAGLFSGAQSGQTVSLQILQPQPPLDLAGVRWTPVAGLFNGVSRFDLEFDLVLDGPEPALILTYRADERANQDHHLALCRNLIAALRAIGSSPAALVSSLTTLDPRAVTPVIRGAAVDDTAPRTWLELLQAQTALTPDAPALHCADEVISFAELSGRIAQRARGLVQAGLRRGDRLALLLPRGLEQIVVMHAAWRCGVCVVPFDPSEPIERLRLMLRDAAVAAVAISSQHADVVAGIAPVLDLSDHAPADMPTSELSSANSDDPAYLLYTSGTSGRPKGVLADHGNLAAFIRAQLSTSSSGRVGLTAAISFDVYLAQLVHLLRGACVVVADDQTYRNPQRLAEWSRSHDVRYLDLTVSMARAALSYGLDTFLTDRTEWLELGGEAVDLEIWQWLRQHSVRGENGYGPTETTITATTAPFSDYETPTIGLPVSGTWVYVVGPEGRLAPLGASGELVIGGPLVTRGYPQSPRTTADRFIPDPYALAPGGRAYRTGDRVRLRPDGALDFLGRVDEQLKIRGHRVDPFEVEDVLRQLPGVREAYVARRTRASEIGVVAYVVATTELDARALLRLCALHLPIAAVPHAVVFVASLPMNVNGKVDEGQLPAPVRELSTAHEIGDDPVLQAWAAQLGGPPAADDDNFFELGGTSLSAAALVASLNQMSGAAVDLADFFSTPSVAGLRHAVARSGSRNARRAAQPGRVSSAQRRLWLAHELEPDSDEFTVPWGLIISGSIDPAEITARWHSLLARHDGLRLRLERGPDGPVAQQHAIDRMAVTWSKGTVADVERAMDRAAHRCFDPTNDPLIELHVISLEDHRTGFVFSAHHLVIDQASIAVIEDEIVRGVPHDPPTSSMEMGREDSEVDRTFWTEQLCGDWDDPWQELGFAPTTRSHAGAAVRHVFDADIWGTITHSVRRRRTTYLALLCAAAWAVAERHGSTDIVVGTTMDVRQPGEESLVGLYVNPVAVRLRPDPWLDADRLVAYAGSELRRAHAHRRLPFDEVVRLLHRAPSPTGAPVFQMLLDVSPRATAGRIEVTEHVAKYDLSITLSEDGVMGVTYRTDRFTESQVDALTAQLAQSLTVLADSTEIPVRRLPLLDAAQERLLATMERGEAITAGMPLLPELLRRHAERAPDQPALTCNGVTLRWGELWSAASRVASDLCRVGVSPGDLVVITGPRSAEVVIAATGVLLSGAGYVPVDPHLPHERWQALVAATDPAAVVSTQPVPADLLDPAVPIVLVPTDHSGPTVPVSTVVAAHDPAYVIHTSGTTGQPKAVVVDHARLAYSTAARRQVYGGRTTFLLLSALTFDSSVAGLWGTLAEGGHVVVATDEEVRDPERLLSIVAEQGVERMLCVPSLHENLVNAAERVGGFPACLGEVVVAGEALPASLPDRHFARTRALLVNEYGPTETTVWCTYQRLGQPGAVHIGGPIPGAVVRLLDTWGRRVPLGVRGEICIGGPGVTDGYRGRPGATAAAFVPDPWGDPGNRLYRTGDVGRRRLDGGLEFLGRRDDMVKIRGHRVELEGLDEVLRACPGVTGAAAVVSNGQLAAAVTGTARLDLDEVRRALRRQLPSYLIPSPLVVLDALPRNANGKLDRAAVLPWLGHATTALPRPAVGGSLGEVALAWAEVLGHDDFDADANFFEAGGHSLAVPRLQDALERHTGTRPSLIDLFTEVTIAAQVRLLEAPCDGGVAGTAPPTSRPNTPTGTPSGIRRSSPRDRLAETRRRNARPPTIGDPS